jgi:hypothetical protein
LAKFARIARFKNPKIVVNVEPWTKETLPEKFSG